MFVIQKPDEAYLRCLSHLLPIYKITNIQSADKLVIRSEPKCKSHLPRPECSRGATKCAPVQGAAEPQYTPDWGNERRLQTPSIHSVRSVCVLQRHILTHVDRSCCKDGFQCEIYRKSQLRSESFSLLPLCLNSVYLTHVSLFLCDQLFEFIMSFIYAILFCFFVVFDYFVVVYNSCERSTCIWLTMAMQAVLFAQSFTHLDIQTSLIGT